MMRIDVSAPDHTTLSRRGQHLDLTLDRVPTGTGVHLIVDSTGLSILGDGEWAAAKYGDMAKEAGTPGVSFAFSASSSRHRFTPATSPY
jgi:hypothetical protein